MGKRIILFVFAFLSLICANAQLTLFGTTTTGGSNSTGTIFSYQPAGNNYQIIKTLDSYLESPLGNHFILGADGKLYSMTTSGGVNGFGAIFNFDTTTNTYTDLFDFNNTTGASPYGSLLQLPDGTLYGMTSSGGLNGQGVIFSFDPATATYTDVYDFATATGGQPQGSLIQATNGKLYGMAGQGGANSFGVIFSFDPGTLTYADIHDFTGTDGELPSGDLFQAADKKLYGLAPYGGSNSDGVIFSIDTTNAPSYSVLYNFANTGGMNPSGGLIQAPGGLLYGITANGGAASSGVIFSIDTTIAHNYTDLYELTGANGSGASCSMTIGADGNLYGTASGGGASSYGVIFSFSISGSVYTDLFDFNFTQGAVPYSSVLQLPNGRFYSMTLIGGTAQLGIIYSFDPVSDSVVALDNFGTNMNGSRGSAGMILGADGNMYGMTLDGGSFGNGVIYKVDTTALTYSVIYNFDAMHGSNPYGTLVQGKDGKLYGLTSAGGPSIFSYFGAVFSFDLTTGTYTDINDFDGVVAADPTGGLVQATDGKLYGMTSGSQTSGNGNIFSVDPTTSTYASLYSFSSTGGDQPYGGLIQATDGKLYGMTNYGGANASYGTIFSFDPTSSTYVDLYDFSGLASSGGQPLGSLIQGSNGKLYGMTSGDYAFPPNSNIFSYDPSTPLFTSLQTLNAAGCNGTLLQVADSMMYGVTAVGGASSEGNIFSFNLNSNTYSDLYDFSSASGAAPGTGSVLVAINIPSALPVELMNFYGILEPNQTVTLRWQTAQEQNSSYYGIERSTDGQHFTAIGLVKAAGNSNLPISYSFTDTSPLSGNNFYRLNMVDIDGKQKYSQVVLVIVPAGSNTLEILNNPFTQSFGVKITAGLPGKVNLTLTDVIGRILVTQSITLLQGENLILMTPPPGMPSGAYILNLKGSGFGQAVKVIKY